ncbi:MAG TPA: P-loop NTPase [Candidatus Obscuribacterales bacterium]
MSPAENVRRIIGVLGAKGGVGATTTAINLAWSLSASGRRTTLIDAVLQQPDVATMLGCEPQYTLADLLARAEAVDAEMFRACCVDFPTGAGSVSLLSPPPDGHAAVRCNLSQLAVLLDAARTFSGVCVLDLPRHLDRHLVSVLDRLSVIVVVFEPTLAAVAAAQRWLGTLAELGYRDESVVCLLNRSGSGVRAVEQECLRLFAGRTLVKVPNAFRLAERLSTDGEPPVITQPRQAYSRAFKLLQSVIEERA